MLDGPGTTVTAVTRDAVRLGDGREPQLADQARRPGSLNYPAWVKDPERRKVLRAGRGDALSTR
ncbi:MULTISPECIES: hypothetical protein [unclassified Nonomuraea]|uniref:hypothetical protein n=1 Tax=unclassified Nonomuraea TaxID=2593643 RepID=UPI001486B697|nr:MULTISPECIES: hypothetical protein [unclassified Nonomuraea]